MRQSKIQKKDIPNLNDLFYSKTDISEVCSLLLQGFERPVKEIQWDIHLCLLLQGNVTLDFLPSLIFQNTDKGGNKSPKRQFLNKKDRLNYISFLNFRLLLHNPLNQFILIPTNCLLQIIIHLLKFRNCSYLCQIIIKFSIVNSLKSLLLRTL